MRINATHQELATQPCDDHTDAVSSACLKCLMWAAHGNDLAGEKEVDFSFTEPTTSDLCKFPSDQLLFERIRTGTDDFDQDWLNAMTQEARAVINIINASDINKGKKEFSDILAKPQNC